MKKLLVLFGLLVMLIVPISLSATTIDLLPLFDTNGNGEIYFGDGYSSIPPDLDHYNLGTVSRTFDLPDTPILPGNFTFSVISSGVDYTDRFSLNGGALNTLHSGSQTFVGNNTELLLNGNTVTFNIGASGSNLDDFVVTAFTLAYTESDVGQNPVPEPATMVLFGIGILGLAGVSRKKS